MKKKQIFSHLYSTCLLRSAESSNCNFENCWWRDLKGRWKLLAELLTWRPQWWPVQIKTALVLHQGPVSRPTTSVCTEELWTLHKKSKTHHCLKLTKLCLGLLELKGREKDKPGTSKDKQKENQFLSCFKNGPKWKYSWAVSGLPGSSPGSCILWRAGRWWKLIGGCGKPTNIALCEGN